MTRPGTISLRIDINTAKDEKICDLIPFVRIERLQMNDSFHPSNDTLGLSENDSIRESPSPPPAMKGGRRDQNPKSLDSHSKNNPASPTPPLRRTRRRGQQPKSLQVQSINSLDSHSKNSPASPTPTSRRTGRRGQEPKYRQVQSINSLDDSQTVSENNPDRQNSPLSPQRRIETRGQETKALDRRPFKCSLCTERFHTSVLLAVHMRIHDKDSDEDDEDEDDEDDEEYVDDVQTFSGNELKSAKAKPRILSVSSSSKSKENQNSVTNVLNSSLAGDKNVTSTILTSDDESVCSLVSSSGLPSPKQKKDCLLKRRGPIKLLKCKECPASFSRQWYLDLHLILLHYVHKKKASLKCPGCQTIFINEHHLRQHIETSHSSDLYIMHNEISSALALTTDALTGEHIKYQKRRGANQPPHNLESSYQVRRPVYASNSTDLPRDWRMASSWEKDNIVDLIEAELKYIAIERNKMGDHFSYSHIQRLSLEICEYLQISNFFDNNPPKRWAQRVLIKVRQVPRPGRFRFVHNVNASYLNAVSELSNRGLSENKIFYAFEARICDVKNDGTAKRVPKTPIGSTSPDVSVEDTICTVICTNANGSVLLHPTIIFRGQIADIESLHKLKALTISHPSKDFLENAYFQEWFAQFLLAIPPARPILLLVEGNVSHLSFRIMMMARENDVHILFVPSRKRFVHSHQLIREALMLPLMREFDKEVVRHLETHNFNSFHVKDFGKLFEPAWQKALPGAEIRKSFIQSGFLPLPNSTEPLEVAARGYLDEVIAVGKGTKTSADVSSSVMPKSNSQAKSTTNRSPPVASQGSDHSSLTSGTSPSHVPCKIKEEPVDLDQHDSSTNPPVFKEIKEEHMESNLGGPTIDGIKQEVVDFPVSSQTLDDIDVLKFDSEEHECTSCSKFFLSNSDLSTHQCSVESRKLENRKDEAAIGPSAEEFQYHSCPHCLMSFALKESLLLHINTRHVPKVKKIVLKSRSQETILRRTHAGQADNPVFKLAQKRKFAPEEEANSLKRKKDVSFTGAVASSPGDSGTDSNSSTSSRTLTASPESTNEHAYSVISSRPLPPPPLPEHDYLGQLYKQNAIPKQKEIDKIEVVRKKMPSPVQKVLHAMRKQNNKKIIVSTITFSKRVLN
ncbi:Ras-responsive element-binding protein 1 [Frankliniella fusca]|uniref:Ras-responsive element-binding protein 1 n=1 Tax=Frankliniella fusca TaxID=407009 RepID=A0AAE1HDH3_9NEOP|nr:Ras-responsive element-binding protein 1 [Frankliniella fusca]